MQASLMSELQVEYNPDYATAFDRWRTLPADTCKTWLRHFGNDLGLAKSSHLLDLGCGSGIFAVAIADHFGCAVTGVDRSRPMLEIAAGKKCANTRWVHGEAERIPCQAGVFSACLLSHVLHQLTERQRVLDEVFRVLAPGSRLGIRCSSHRQLKALLEYRFFPLALEVDLLRAPDVPEVRQYVRNAGFENLREIRVHERYVDSPDQYMAKLRARYTSGLQLVPEDAYKEGLEQAAQYLADHGMSEANMHQVVTFLVAGKPKARAG